MASLVGPQQLAAVPLDYPFTVCVVVCCVGEEEECVCVASGSLCVSVRVCVFIACRVSE